MNILYISQCFLPEMGAAPARVSELSRAWVQEGHQVTVLTGFPNHPTGEVPPEYRGKLRRLVMRDDFDNVIVQRTWLIPLPNRKAWERMLLYFSFAVSAALRGLFLPKPQVVIATSPQLLVGLSGLIVAKWKRVPFIFEVRDLWPESLEAVGVRGKKSMLVRVLGKVAGLLYRRADHVVVVTHAFKTHLEREWAVPGEKISVVVNAVDDKVFCPQPAQPAILDEFGLHGRFVVGYIGTIGSAHGIDTLVALAELLQVSDPEIFFLVIGEGAEKEKLEQLAADKHLSNLRVFSGQPRGRIPAIIAASGVCLVLLKKSELFKTVIPTKILEFMACGRPLVAAVEGEAADLINKAGAGICVPPGDAPALAEAIRFLHRSTRLREQMGKDAREFVVRELGRESTAHAYLSVLQSVMELTTKPAGTARSAAHGQTQ
jgi:colanic acid biosynthesis glycosyl transferase WcaI